MAPAFNEEDTIERFVAAWRAVLSTMASEGVLGDWRLMVIDDGSTDDTPRLLKILQQGEPRLDVIRLGTNTGYAGALNAGLGACTADWVLATDADLPFDPKEFPRLWAMATQGRADLLAAYRVERSRQEPKRALMSQIYGALVRWRYGLNVRDFNCACKLIPREALRSVLPLHSRSLFVDPELLIRARRAGVNIIQAPITYQTRQGGQSTLGSWPNVWATLKEVWRFPEG